MPDHTLYFSRLKDETVREGYLSQEMADFYEDLFAFQKERITSGTGADFSSNIDITSFPALDPEKLSFEGEVQEELKKDITGLLGIIEKYHPGINTQYIADAVEDRWDHLASSIAILFMHDTEKLGQAAEEMKIGLDEYIFILVNWVKPLMSLVSASSMEGVDTDEWLAPVCPFCGYLADMGKIIEARDNRRMLHCGICEYEWYFPRVTCAICENTDTETLGYLSVSDDSPYRVDYCDKCKGYIKTLRIPKMQEESRYDLTVENLVTTWLDASAMELGYRRP